MWKAESDSGALIAAQIQRIYQHESRRVLATLIRLLGDFELAEEALQEAFSAALKQWPNDGIPDNPRAWLVSAGRFKAIDQIRRNQRFAHLMQEFAPSSEPDYEEDYTEQPDIEDDRLRLIFTCCHPALSIEAQLALTLREICDLSTDEIARAFLTSSVTLAQRIVRAKNKIRDAKIPYVVPGEQDLPERLESVLHVIYLVFNEGYSATTGDDLIRQDLCSEAIRLGHLLRQLLPDGEVSGLLALMLLQDARRMTRHNAEGDLIQLEFQDRRQWDHAQIRQGLMLVQEAMLAGEIGSFALQAAIAAQHALAIRFADTDWQRIVQLYDLLRQASPTPVVELNRAAAIAMRDGPQAGIQEMQGLENKLAQYHLFHAARADMYRRLGQLSEARQAYAQALSLTKQGPEMRFLQKCLVELEK
ncbi:RNA polymerase sigma factor [Bowmanella pacifica]|uniref:DNA-directed RNA polymerase sigma-70 factor n=1 Tax=Bowmanella pacifica TaxID=502051 RepID=A0A917Z5C1_9ALTE|nr:RNA polymerase sigma factor [Bowmanella pacifica]GGO73510.1 DNA-directed RNA polymerase sigma-70 factor [Bowmanella pacifica]